MKVLDFLPRTAVEAAVSELYTEASGCTFSCKTGMCFWEVVLAHLGIFLGAFPDTVTVYWGLVENDIFPPFERPDRYKAQEQIQEIMRANDGGHLRDKAGLRAVIQEYSTIPFPELPMLFEGNPTLPQADEPLF